MNDEIMTGRNPSADQALARDLGVTLSPEQDEICPPVILGNKGYETDASGEPIETMPQYRERRHREDMANYEEMSAERQTAFLKGFLAAKSQTTDADSVWNRLHVQFAAFFTAAKG